MIVVRIELHSAITGRVTEIGRMLITNRGTTRSAKRGDYDVALMRRGKLDKVQRKGEVLQHARLSASVWSLVAKALASVGFDVKSEGGQQSACVCCGDVLVDEPVLCERCHGSFTEYTDGSAYCDAHEPEDGAS